MYQARVGWVSDHQWGPAFPACGNQPERATSTERTRCPPGGSTLAKWGQSKCGVGQSVCIEPIKCYHVCHIRPEDGSAVPARSFVAGSSWGRKTQESGGAPWRHRKVSQLSDGDIAPIGKFIPRSKSDKGCGESSDQHPMGRCQMFSTDYVVPCGLVGPVSRQRSWRATCV